MPFLLFSQETPAGLGSGFQVNMWLKADEISTLSDGDLLSINWTDKSGNDYHASQSNSSYQPVFKDSVINGFPVIRFDGTDDFLDGLHSYNARTVFSVFKTSSTLQNSSELGQIWGNEADDAHVAIDTRAGANDQGFNFQGLNNSPTRAKYALNGSAYGSLVSSSNVPSWTYDQFELIAVEFKKDKAMTRQVIGSLYPGQSIGSHQFGGDIAEIIVFNGQLGETQKILVENYLATKYDLTISDNKYAYNTTHKFDLAGIGRINGSDNQSSAFSAGILGIESSSIFNGEFVTIAHDNQDVSSWQTGSLQDGIPAKMLSRSWRVDKNGTAINLDFSVDTSNLPSLPSGYEAWVLMVDEDGDFSSDAKFYGLSKGVGALYTAAGISVNSGEYISIAAAKNISVVDGDFSNASTWAASVPGSSDSIIISSYNTVNLSQDETVGHVYVSDTGSFQLNSFTLNISLGSLKVDGNLDMGTGTVNYSANGNQNIAALVYNNLSISGSGNKSLITNTVVANNMILNAGTLDLNISGDYTLQVAGNWINNGSVLEPRNGTVELNGVTAQDITTNGEAFYDFKVSGSGPYNLLDDLELSNQLIMENGVIVTSSNELFVNNTSGTAIPTYSNTSYINGYLKRAIAFGTFNYLFPVGNGTLSTDYHPAEISSNMLMGVNTITSSFTNLVRHNDVDLNASDTWLSYQSVSNAGMWIISPDQQPSGGLYSVKLYLDNISGLQDNQFAVVKRPEGASDASEWKALGSINMLNGLGRKLSDGYALRTGLSSFSEFGIGSGSSSGGLPIELLYFDAIKVGETVELEWVTSTEINTDYFEIQRSLDGINFETIGKLSAAGNSIEEIEYTFIDSKPEIGDNYYRIKQVDLDQKYEYLPIRVVNFEYVETLGEVKIYPNPSNGEVLNVQLEKIDLNTGQFQIDIYNIQGKKVYSEGNFTDYNLTIELNGKLQSGVYLIDIHNAKQHQKVKWIIN